MNEIERKLEFCYEQIREKTDFVPEVALILGSGLGELADEIQVEKQWNIRKSKGFLFLLCRGIRDGLSLAISGKRLSS